MKKGFIILGIMLAGILPAGIVPMFSQQQVLPTTHENHPDTLTVEQQQQFLYYFYEAQRMVQAEKLDTAWELMQFCYELNPHDATVNHYIGCFLQALDQQQAAHVYFTRAFEWEPATYYYRYAVQLLQSDSQTDHLKAIGDLEKLALTERKNPDILFLLQKAYLLENNFTQALLLQDRLDSINGYNAQSALQRYRLHTTLNQPKEAIRELERYLEIDPDDYQFQVLRLQHYEQTRQKPDKLIKAYREVLRLNPRNLLALNNLAWNICISHGDLQQAEQYSRITILSEPSNATYLDTYAWIKYHQKDYETALFYIERAREHADENTSKEVEQHYQTIKKKVKK